MSYLARYALSLSAVGCGMFAALPVLLLAGSAAFWFAVSVVAVAVLHETERHTVIAARAGVSLGSDRA